jgi:hypothetical protein
LLIVATPGTEEAQVTVDVNACVVPSVKIPVATNCKVVPSAIVAIDGVTMSAASGAVVTVRVVVPVTPWKVALIVVVPAATAVASPGLPAALLIVATPGTEETQVTVVVRSWLVPSLKIPTAVNGRVVLTPIVGLVGVASSARSVAVVTVSVVVPVTPWKVALIVAVPAATAVASPGLPAALLIVATLGFAELQVTEDVNACVVPSGRIPVATNCKVVPSAMVAMDGVTVIAASVPGMTVRVVVPMRPWKVALILVVPAVTAVACPGLPAALLIVATPGTEEAQVTVVVRSWLVPSLKMPTAVNGRVVLTPIVGLVGVTVIAARVAAVTVRVLVPVRPWKVALIVVEPAATAVTSP